MADALRPFNRHVGVFPNHVAVLPAVRDAQDSDPANDRPTIFLALNREADWAPILPELNRVLERSA